jgi:hypothetical protein
MIRDRLGRPVSSGSVLVSCTAGTVLVFIFQVNGLICYRALSGRFGGVGCTWYMNAADWVSANMELIR